MVILNKFHFLGLVPESFKAAWPWILSIFVRCGKQKRHHQDYLTLNLTFTSFKTFCLLTVSCSFSFFSGNLISCHPVVIQRTSSWILKPWKIPNLDWMNPNLLKHQLFRNQNPICWSPKPMKAEFLLLDGDRFAWVFGLHSRFFGPRVVKASPSEPLKSSEPPHFLIFRPAD